MSVMWQSPINLPAGYLGIVGNEAGVRIAVRVDDHGRIVFASDGDEIAVPPDLARALALIVIAATGSDGDFDRDFAAAMAVPGEGAPS